MLKEIIKNKIGRCGLLALIFCGSLFTGCSEPNIPASSFSLGSVTEITVPSGCNGFAKYFPDGKLSLVKRSESRWQIFWAERKSFLTEGETPWPEDHYSQVRDDNIVFGEGKSSVTNLNENGSWFIGVYPLDENGRYVGFFHGESWWTTDASSSNYGVAHKSIGVAYSDDYGKNWKDAAPIIVDSNLKPSSPQWSGLGDGCVIWDDKNGRWICYYQGKVGRSGNMICMAVSYDREGKSGTWKKWDGKDFTIKAYDTATNTGGKNVAVNNLNKIPGANPSVIWNSYLNRYVMVYHSWGGKVAISFSDDGIFWSSPDTLFSGMYPNLISLEGDSLGGQNVRIYYAKDMKSDGTRTLSFREINF